MNDTSSTARLGWTNPNCGRGTMQLIYSCLSTIFLCTWTVYHDEVYTGNRIVCRLWWMLVSILTPEVVMFKALRQYIEARDLTERMLLQRYWSVEHSWLTNMGGIILVWIDPEDADNVKFDTYSTRATGLAEHLLADSDARSNDESLPATGAQIFWLSRRRKLDLDAFPRKEEIRDKSKSSYLLNGIACFEGIWFLALLIARAAYSLPISALEISTLSYVACSFITYGLWWYKPHDIVVPIRVPCKMLDEQEEIQYQKVESDSADSGNRPYSRRFLNLYALMKQFPAYENSTFKNGMLAISIVFGGVHMAAWGSSLPTKVEEWLFRVCSLLSTITAPALFYILRSYGKYWDSKSLMGRLRTFLMFGMAGLYLGVRLFLMIEPFVALRSVPAGVYEQIHWVAFIPHII